MERTAVAAIRCSSYDPRALETALERQFQLLGGLNRFVKPGDRVLIKPNFIAPKPVSQPAQTHPQIILAVGRLLTDLGARPFVGDSPAWGTVFSCAGALEGLTEGLAQLGIPLRALRHPRPCHVNAHTTVGISALALEADAIINIPKLKAHQQMVATLALKNMFGCVSGKKKPYWHFARGQSRDTFADLLLGIYRQIPTSLSLIDGIVAMHGNGPINGDPCDVGWLVAGADAVACETVCAHLVHLTPEQVPLLRAARRADFGVSDLAQIDCRGDSIDENRCADFSLPSLVPIRFSLPRVIRSVTTGMIRSLKSGLRRPG